MKSSNPNNIWLDLVFESIFSHHPRSTYNEKNGMLEHHFSQLLTGIFLDEYSIGNFI